MKFETYHFAHPDSEAFKPGLTVTPAGQVRIIDESESIRQSILMLLSTRKGERVMRPDYGSDLRHLVFSPLTDSTAGLAAHYVRQALNRWEPRIRVLRVEAAIDPDAEGVLRIDIDYRIRKSERLQQLAYLFQVGYAER